MRERPGLEVGQSVTIKGVAYTFQRAIPEKGADSEQPYALQFEDTENGAIERFAAADFHDLVASGDIRLTTRGERGVVESPEERCDAGEACVGCQRCKSRKVRANRLFLLNAYDQQPVSKSDKALNRWLDEQWQHTPHPSVKVPKAAVLRRLLRERGEPGDRRPYQMHDAYKTGAGRRRVSKDYLDAFEELSPWYWSNVAHHASDLHDKIAAKLDGINAKRKALGGEEMPIPSTQTTWRLLRTQQSPDNVRRRLGRRAAERMYKPIAGRLEVSRILEVAIIDHTVLDCFVIDDKEHVTIGRPYLTLMVDVKSRYPLGYHLSFTPPSVETTMACLRMAVVHKRGLAARFPDIRPWLAHGCPHTILTDNGKDLANRSFIEACLNACISIKYAPAAMPEYKGVGERLFRTLNSLIHKLPGAVPAKPHIVKDMELEPQNHARLLMSEVDELIYRYITEVYALRVHTELNATPEAVWTDRRGLDTIRIPDMAALNGFGRIVERTLSRKGIELHNLTYCGPSVGQLLCDLLRSAPRRGRSEDTVIVKVKYRPENMSKIWVWDGKTFVEVPCTQPEYTKDLSLYAHQKIYEFAKERGFSHEIEAERRKNAAQLFDWIDEHSKRAKLGHRKQMARVQQKSAFKPLQDGPSAYWEIPSASVADISQVGANPKVPKPKSRKKVAPKPQNIQRGKVVDAKSVEELKPQNLFVKFDLKSRLEKARKAATDAR